MVIDAAVSLNDLRILPGNRLGRLKGDREGQHSIRVNEQRRICFRWKEGGAHDVETAGHHRDRGLRSRARAVAAPHAPELDEAGLTGIPVSLMDIGMMIGERAAVRMRVRSAATRLVAEAASSDPAVPFVVACAQMDNLASGGALARAGFRSDRELDDLPNRRYPLMVRHGQGRQVA